MTLSPNEPITHGKLLQQEVDELREMVETGAGTGGINPGIINAKGDIIVGSANDIPTIIPVGTNGQVLSADSSTSTGLKWVTVSTGGGTGSVTSVAGRTGDVMLTASDVGLGNVSNTSDANKPVSAAVQTALNSKANSADLTSHVNSTSNPHSVTKAQVGLSNVDNTSDVNKPISTAVQTALNAKADQEATAEALAAKANTSDVTTALASKADLVAGKVPAEQLPAADASAGVQVWEWYVDTATQGAGTVRRYNDSGQTLTIVAVRVRTNINAPDGSDLIADLNKNGSTVFTTQANRPRVIVGTQDSGKVTNMNITSVEDGAYLVPDIDQVGSIVPGSGVLVSVTLR